MIDLIFKFLIVTGFALGIVWFSVYYLIVLKYKSDPHFQEARSKVSFIKTQPRTTFNLFSVYRYIEITIYFLFIIACALLALQYGLRWLGK